MLRSYVYCTSLAAAAACAPQYPVAPTRPPPAPTLHVCEIEPGTTTAVRVDGAPPDSQVFLLRSRRTGAGPCPQLLGGSCLSLLYPITAVGPQEADGAVLFDLEIPQVPLPASVSLQAVVFDSGSVLLSAPLTVSTGAKPDSDSDFDGVCDAADPCPLDRHDDSDGDGSCDSDDPCPNAPGDDADLDGVCDDVDQCPPLTPTAGTPWTRGSVRLPHRAPVFEGGSPQAFLGYEFASAGDLTGDGCPDLWLGAPGDGTAAGTLHLVDPRGATGVIDVGVNSVLTVEGAPGDRSGRTVETCDLNGDRLPELLFNAGSGDGGLRVLRGESLRGAQHSMSADSNITISGVSGSFGWFVRCADDITGDQVSDIVVSAQVETPPGGQSGAGAVYVLSGAEVYNLPDGVSTPLLALSSLRIDGDLSGGALGEVLTIHDFDASGVPDLLLSRRGAVNDPVEIWVFSGEDVLQGFHGAGVWSRRDARWILTAGPNHANYNWQISGGHLDLDLIPDFLIARRRDACVLWGAQIARLAAAHVGGGPQVIDLDQPNACTLLDTGIASTTLDNASIVGDLDGDGLDDLALGDGRSAGLPCAGSEPGYMYVVSGAELSGLAYYDLNQATVRLEGAVDRDGLGGFVLPIGDINGDGLVDMAASAIMHDPNVPNCNNAFPGPSGYLRGRVYVLVGAASFVDP